MNIEGRLSKQSIFTPTFRNIWQVILFSATHFQDLSIPVSIQGPKPRKIWIELNVPFKRFMRFKQNFYQMANSRGMVLKINTWPQIPFVAMDATAIKINKPRTAPPTPTQFMPKWSLTIKGPFVLLSVVFWVIIITLNSFPYFRNRLTGTRFLRWIIYHTWG